MSVKSYEEFQKLKQEYDNWVKGSHSMSLKDMEIFLSEMLPTEKYLKERYLYGYRESLWVIARGEDDRFKKIDENIAVYRHFRYDTHQIHSHDFFQIIYVYSGCSSVYISKDSMEISQGDLILLMPGTEHRLAVNNDECIVIKIYIRSSTFEKTFYRWLYEDNQLSDLFRQSIYNNRTGNYMVYRTGEDEVIRRNVLSLYTEYLNAGKYNDIVEECLLTEIFCYLIRNYSESLDRNGISAVLKYIIDHRATVTLDELSDKMGYTKNYICRMIKQSTGLTFLDILFTARLTTAKKLLIENDMTIDECSQHSGFTNVKQFYRVFRKSLGTTPKSFREENKKAQLPKKKAKLDLFNSD